MTKAFPQFWYITYLTLSLSLRSCTSFTRNFSRSPCLLHGHTASDSHKRKRYPSLHPRKGTHHDLFPKSNTKGDVLTDRRKAVASIIASSVLTSNRLGQVARADTSIISPLPDPSSALAKGLLDGRVTENVLSSPVYGMESNDIFYPSYFNGVWSTTSTTTSIEAPCGTALFGGNATFANAQNEVGTSLRYRARFVTTGGNTVIADRDFNVREIAKAAMGGMSVIDVSIPSPNKVSCLLAPAGANKVFNVDLLTVNRRQETVSDESFDCAEVVRQILSSPESGSGRVVTAPVLKEIETVSLYTVSERESSSGAVTGIRCRQRSATFLLPSQTDPAAFDRWRMARGRPVDVRFYDVVYKKSNA